MVYPNNFEEKTGFRFIRERIQRHCLSPLGQRWCEEMRFSADFDFVRLRLQQTDEMLGAVNGATDIPIENLYDVTPELKRIEATGAYLEPDTLKHLRATLKSASAISSFFAKKDSDSGNYLYPSLYKALGAMEEFPAVIGAIDSVIAVNGSVKDTASPELSDIRRSIRSVSSSMSGIMRRVIDRVAKEGIFGKDTVPTLRDGRLVIPVPSQHKRSLEGIVHDESASGKTVFMEPAEVVEANNCLRELEASERREVIRILIGLSDTIRPFLKEISETLRLVGLFDFIRAKALVAVETEASMPKMDKTPVVEWYHAIHPVLASSLKSQGREVVPLDINLNERQRILVISGPNAGGKSVTLKTVGIIQYMLQCGLLPPVYSNSHVSVFSDILLDIGDEQSIENDLSTYSSHLRNMKQFMAAAGRKSLFLIDEMGSGTEPHFGGALARSILERLNLSQAMGIVTTHYQTLKEFADETDGIINGAMLYDRQKMKPLFVLSIGSPGSSFALEIARSTGLPSEVIEKAKELVGQDYVDSEKYMLDIARDRRYWSNKRLSIKEKEHKLQKLVDEYEAASSELRSRKAEILAKARKEASEILSNSNAALEKTIHEIRKTQAEKERTKQLRKELEDYKQQLTDTSSDTGIEILKQPKKNRKSAKKLQKSSAAPVETALSVGSHVIMEGGHPIGTILAIEGKKATVSFGGLKTLVSLDKLKATNKVESIGQTSPAHMSASRKSTVADYSRSRQLNFSRELDVRGMRVDEALQAVTYFIDDAVQFEADQVRILHGTGTGALRVAIRQLLQSNPSVRQFHDEDVRFGGAGITVVKLE